MRGAMWKQTFDSQTIIKSFYLGERVGLGVGDLVGATVVGGGVGAIVVRDDVGARVGDFVGDEVGPRKRIE